MKPADEMAESLDGRGVLVVPMLTLAKLRGMVVMQDS